MNNIYGNIWHSIKYDSSVLFIKNLLLNTLLVLMICILFFLIYKNIKYYIMLKNIKRQQIIFFSELKKHYLDKLNILSGEIFLKEFISFCENFVLNGKYLELKDVFEYLELDNDTKNLLFDVIYKNHILSDAEIDEIHKLKRIIQSIKLSIE